MVNAFAGDKAVSSAKMFGALSLKVGDKAFAMLYKGDLVIKLPRERVDALAKSAVGKPFEPSTGRVMKEWISVGPNQQSRWLPLAKEARAFVAKLSD